MNVRSLTRLSSRVMLFLLAAFVASAAPFASDVHAAEPVKISRLTVSLWM